VIHVGTVGPVWVCATCAAGKRELGPVEDPQGPLARVASLDRSRPTMLEYLTPCPWCGDDSQAVRHAMIVRLCVADADQAKRRGLDESKVRAVDTAGELVAKERT
jgi:hypothetical protein